jgi:cation diffusion facilitator CzcD-associated flavoprotein CzcO
MRRQLKDPDVRRRAWPDYTFGCKRVLFSSHFLPALQRPNVELVTDPIERLSPSGVHTASGQEHAVDCIIYGTGFKTTDFMFPMEITGAGGTSLRDAWAAGPHAHLGLAVPGFPSLFVMYGHRDHATIELAIRDLKDQALAHFPTGRFAANSAWTVIAALSHNPGRWSTQLGLPNRPVQTARARRLHLLQIPARLTRTSRQWTLRMPARWPWQNDFNTVLDRIRALPTLA